ncbi:MAG: Asp-tRNA(Asn)/Glu-tRNA(Gln) amidotransferase subunit GatC [Clostridiales bacterium]|mgnify:CR=1 FL=1|nr:Asp-tRNA(Asn)/Glu-tRNA(Gln) amidotransferase subunit GatC [Clostridiales bacterium]
MSINQEAVKKLEALSRLELTQDEREEFTQLLGQMIEAADFLGGIDSRGASAMISPNEKTNVLRADTVGDSPKARDLLERAPRHKEGFFEVPKTLD